MSEEKKHISPSQLGTYLRCPRSWSYRYVDGLKMPPSSAMSLGSSFHKGVEVNYKQKIKTEKDLPVSDMQDAFVDDWKERVKTDDPQFSSDKGESATSMQDLGVKLVKVQRDEIAPLVQPVAVEETFEVSLGQDFPFTLKGIIDVVTEAGIIADNKTGASKIKEDALNSDLQLSAYSLGYRLKEQRNETALELHRVIKTKKPGTQMLRTTRTDEQIRWFLRLVEQVAAGMVAGIFPPNPTGWWCSPTHCGFYKNCMERRG